MRKTLCFLLALALTLSLCGCSAIGSLLGGGVSPEDIQALVQGNLDVIYLGTVDEGYVDRVDSTMDELLDQYMDGLEVEAEFFAQYFNVEYVDDDLKQQIVALYDQIYSHSSFTVGAASKLDENSYAVKLTVRPIDVMEQVVEDFEEGMADYYEKYAGTDADAMTEEEYRQLDRDWADGIIALCYQKLETVGYCEEQSLVIQVEKDSEDSKWCITDSDMGNIDALIISYP